MTPANSTNGDLTGRAIDGITPDGFILLSRYEALQAAMAAVAEAHQKAEARSAALEAALAELVEVADNAAWAANIGTMDEAIRKARALLSPESPVDVGEKMTGWNDNMDAAPRDGTPIQARIPGHGDDNIIAWIGGLLNSAGDDCGGWAMVEDQDPPDCWTDGVCWEVNADGIQSMQPTHWKPLEPPA